MRLLHVRLKLTMSALTPCSQMPFARCRAWLCLLPLLTSYSSWAVDAMLPSSTGSYLSQAARVRQSIDRPWAPDAGRLGNLRHLQITARDCVVRVVSGSENRVFPGTRDVVVVERSRVLDTDPNEQPVPRDVVLAPDRAQACPGMGSCGLSVTSATAAPHAGAADKVCFTVQIATAHDLLIGGDRLSVLVDHVRQPALRIAINPSANLRLWLEQVDIGLLSLSANAAVTVGGNGEVDFLQGSSSNSGSNMMLHEFRARHVGVTTTTTGTHWSIRIGTDTEAGYYQPARAPGRIAENYGIEIDGAIERLDVPASRVDPHPLSKATIIAARSLRSEVLEQAGPAPVLPASNSNLPLASVAAAALPGDARERVAHIVARYLPASVRITDVTLWKKGGRLEGIAPDAASARDIVRLLKESGEFTYVSGGNGIPGDDGYKFSTQMYFSCDAPGLPSECPAGDPAQAGAYSEMQVRAALDAALGKDVMLRDVHLAGDRIDMKAVTTSEAEARAGLERIGQQKGFFRLSTSGIGPPRNGSVVEIDATLRLTCAVPPKPDGICTPAIR